jgi:hypothetical protein
MRTSVKLLHGIVALGAAVDCNGETSTSPTQPVFYPAQPPDDSACEQAPGNHCETPAPSPGKFDEPRCKDRGGTVLDLVRYRRKVWIA